MKYILMDYVSEAGWPKLTKPEQEHWLGAYNAYTEAMAKAGVLKSSAGLQPTSSATTVRVAHAKDAEFDAFIAGQCQRRRPVVVRQSYL